MVKKIHREMAVKPPFLQLHFVNTYESHHTKGETWNSLTETAASTLQKRLYPPPSSN